MPRPVFALVSMTALDVVGSPALVVSQAGLSASAPLVLPEVTLIAPGVDGPKLVSQLLSLIE